MRMRDVFLQQGIDLLEVIPLWHPFGLLLNEASVCLLSDLVVQEVLTHFGLLEMELRYRLVALVGLLLLGFLDLQ